MQAFAQKEHGHPVYVIIVAAPGTFCQSRNAGSNQKDQTPGAKDRQGALEGVGDLLAAPHQGEIPDNHPPQEQSLSAQGIQAEVISGELCTARTFLRTINRTCNGNLTHTDLPFLTKAQREPLDEVAQQLVAALLVVWLPLGPEERAQL